MKQIFIMISIIVTCLGCRTSGVESNSKGNSNLIGVPLRLEPIENQNSVSFIALGDTGTGDENQIKVARAMENWCYTQQKSCDFVLLLGDNFYSSGVLTKVDPFDIPLSDPQWVSKFITPYNKLKMQFFPTMGNHDYVVLGNRNFAPEKLLGNFGWEERADTQVMTLAELGPLKFMSNKGGVTSTYPKWYFPKSYHSFIRGPGSFMALDTPRLIFNKDIEDQRNVIKIALYSAKRKNLKWKIAFGHHPLYSNGSHGNAGQYSKFAGIIKQNLGEETKGTYLKKFFLGTQQEPGIICENYDLYLSGHDHNRQLLVPTSECPMLNVVSGAGGKITDLYKNDRNEFENKAFWQEESLGFSYVTLNEDSMTVQMVNSDGKVDAAIVCQKDSENKLNCIPLENL